MDRSRGYLILLALLAGAAVLAVLVRSIPQLPRIAETEVREAIYGAVQSEADTAFVITGYVEVIATTRSASTLLLLPGMLNLSLGTTQATVRVPGRVAYGFDLGDFNPEMIRARGDTIEIELPLIRVFSAEPDLATLEVETQTGWARAATTARDAQQRAVQLLTEALRRQGEAHVQQTTQPQVNTARALRRMAEPVVIRLGIPDPHFRVYLGEGLLMEP
jgi:hypothetical protein